MCRKAAFGSPFLVRARGVTSGEEQLAKQNDIEGKNDADDRPARNSRAKRACELTHDVCRDWSGAAGESAQREG